MNIPTIDRSELYYNKPGNGTFGALEMGGEHWDLSASPMPMRFDGFYALVFVTRGRGCYHDVDGLTIDLRTGSALLLFPEHGYRYDLLEPGWGEIWLHFTGPIFDVWRDAEIISPRQPVTQLAPADEWANRLRHLLRPPVAPTAADAIQRVCELQQLLTDIIRQGTCGQPRPEQDQWLKDAQSLLQRESTKPYVDWEHVATELGLSVDRFRKRFKQLSHETPYAYVTQQRIRESCRLLAVTGLRVREIARQCHFNDEFHFSRRFKQLTGQSPTAFRERAQIGRR